MIIKTNKAGKEFESWPTIEEAAKAIKLAPAVLKSHMLKRKPKLLGGFIFKDVPVDIKFTQSTGQIERLEEGTNSRKFWKTEEKASEINFQPAPETDDSLTLNKNIPDFKAASSIKLNEFGEVATEAEEKFTESLEKALDLKIPPESFQDLIDLGMSVTEITEKGFRRINPLSEEALTALTNYRAKGDSLTVNAIMLDEFGDPIDQPSIPSELSETEITENDLLEIQMNARIHRKSQPEPAEHINLEEVADFLRTPLERRLHKMKKQ